MNCNWRWACEQSRQVEQTKLNHAAQVLERLSVRNADCDEEQGSLRNPIPGAAARAAGADSAGSRTHRSPCALTGKERELRSWNGNSSSAPAAVDLGGAGCHRHRSAGRGAAPAAGKTGTTVPILKAWIAAHGLDGAARLWQGSQHRCGLRGRAAERGILATSGLNAVTLTVWMHAPRGPMFSRQAGRGRGAGRFADSARRCGARRCR